jgi:hypothetical protein
MSANRFEQRPIFGECGAKPEPRRRRQPRPPGALDGYGRSLRLEPLDIDLELVTREWNADELERQA